MSDVDGEDGAFWGLVSWSVGQLVGWSVYFSHLYLNWKVYLYIIIIYIELINNLIGRPFY